MPEGVPLPAPSYGPARSTWSWVYDFSAMSSEMSEIGKRNLRLLPVMDTLVRRTKMRTSRKENNDATRSYNQTPRVHDRTRHLDFYPNESKQQLRRTK